MPELPEVETVRRQLEPWLTRRRILDASLADAPEGPKYANLYRASGQRIERVYRRGKFILFTLDGGDELVVHLGMTGVLRPDDPGKHVRAVLTLSGRHKRHCYFQDVRRFGRFLVVPAGRYESLPTLAQMGPEPLSSDFDGSVLYRGLQRSQAPIKSFLLSQKPVAGLGNIYVDEALWRSRIHPRSPANRISRRASEKLARSIIDVLGASLERGGTTLRDYRGVDGQQGQYVERLDAYGRAGQPCRRCGRTLTASTVGQRSTCHCPSCQRKTRPR